MTVTYQKFSTMLFSNVEDDVIYDIHEYATAVRSKSSLRQLDARFFADP